MASPETQLDAIYLNRKALETLNMPTVTLNLPDNYIPWMEKKRIEFGVKSRHAFILLAIRELAKVPMLVPEEIDRSGWPLIEQRFICSECSGSAVRGSKHCGGGVKGIANDDVEKQRIRGICVCPVCSGADAKIG